MTTMTGRRSSGSRRQLVLADQDRAALLKWVRGRTTPQRVAFRARVILLLADGLTERASARQLSTSRQTISLWRRRVEREGIATILRDRPGRGRKPKHLAPATEHDEETAA
jgi:hypothetical protein